MLPLGTGRIYWHVLLGDEPEARALLTDAHQRLDGLNGLDWVPPEWLHLTTLVAGLRHDISDTQIQHMAEIAARELTSTGPIKVKLSRVLYHPEAVLVRAEGGLAPLLKAAQVATHEATGQEGVLDHAPWNPHVTLAYSNATQPAAPVIQALGKELPARELTIHRINLVNQDGPENLWRWSLLASAELRARDDGSTRRTQSR